MKKGVIIGLVIFVAAVVSIIMISLPAYEKMQAAQKELDEANAEVERTQQAVKESQQRLDEFCATSPEC